jgi:hypothetical protein
MRRGYHAPKEAGLKVTYNGPSVAVDLLGPDNRTLQVKRGESIEVPDDYGKQLIEQDIWAEVKERPAPKNDKKGNDQ